MSRYKNAADILPPHLLADLQAYAAGQQIYVPRADERLSWGTRSGARAALSDRNEQIRQLHREGLSMEELMARFHLGYDSIRKIVAGKNGSTRSRC